MTEVDANGSAVTQNIVRASLSEMKKERGVNFLPEKAFLHPIQVLSIVEMSILVSTVVVKIDAPDKIPDHPMTLGGIPVVQVPEMDKSTIEFKDLDGKVCGRIINLGLPVAYEQT